MDGRGNSRDESARYSEKGGRNAAEWNVGKSVKGPLFNRETMRGLNPFQPVAAQKKSSHSFIWAEKSSPCQFMVWEMEGK